MAKPLPSHRRPMSPLGRWLYGVLVAIDQLGNALAGGDPDARISTRVGFHCQRKRMVHFGYWNLLRVIIDFTFLPIDGPDHCAKAYGADHGAHHENGSDAARAILGVVVILFCALLVPVIWLLSRLGYVRKTAVT